MFKSYFMQHNLRNMCQEIIKQQRLRYTVYRKYRHDLRVMSHLQIFNTRYFQTSFVVCKKRKTSEDKKFNKAIAFPPKSKGEVIDVWRNITVAELGKVMKKDVDYIRQIFLDQVNGASTVIDDITVLQHAIRRSGRRMRIIAKPTDEGEETIDKDVYPRPPISKSLMKSCPPVVTVMGHVDHGKTTLLDALRHSRVVDQEFGGITQHIGAFSVNLDSGARITFLDTPGHAAFSAMRARGANLTDIVVLVVAADDGVMEQTIESIKMAKRAKVPILVAINKIDAPKADIERTQNMLLAIGIQVEQLGGDIQAVPISALKRKNLNLLVEALILQAELLEIKADPDGTAEAIVIDSKIHPHKGRLCSVIIKRGTLKQGAVLVAGTSMAKVRTLRDAEGNKLQQITPGYPVEIEGWKDLPPAGETVLEVESEKRAREVIKVRQEKINLEREKADLSVITDKMEEHQKGYKEQLQLKRKLGRFRLKRQGPRKPEIPKDEDEEKTLNIVLKGDVDGTLEALIDTLDTYDSTLCEMDLIHYGVGAITETDIEMAKMFKGIIYAFNVDCPKDIKEKAEVAEVVIKHFNVIYKLVDDVKEELNSRIPPQEVEEVLGEAAILQQFEISQNRKKIPVAGCRCVKGTLKKSAPFRLVRNGEILYVGPVVSMRHLKNEVESIKTNLECGLQISDRSICFKEGDSLVCYEKKFVPILTDWDPGF